VNRLTKPEPSPINWMADLQSNPPRAYVHCAFCHIVWTLCEESKLSHPGVPYTSDQMNKLSVVLGKDRYDAWMRHFGSLTKDVDWLGVRVRKSLKLIENNIAWRKRSRDSEDANEETNGDATETGDGGDVPISDESTLLS
jgi:hypothetical protein